MLRDLVAEEHATLVDACRPARFSLPRSSHWNPNSLSRSGVVVGMAASDGSKAAGARRAVAER